jgi:hypothetical protein
MICKYVAKKNNIWGISHVDLVLCLVEKTRWSYFFPGLPGALGLAEVSAGDGAGGFLDFNKGC